MKKNFWFILLPIILGLAGGAAAAVLFFLLGNILPFGRLNVDSDQNGQVVIDQPKNVIVEQDLQIQQIENNLLPVLVNIYYSKKGTTVASQAFLPSEILGQGFVLTADGWIVTTKSVIGNLKGKYTAVGYQSKQYDLESFVVDEATGIVFAKMPAQSLTVAKLGQSKELTLGQSLVAVWNRDRLNLAQVEEIGYDFTGASGINLSTEKLVKKLSLGLPLTKGQNGAIIANFKGEVVGVADSGKAILVDDFKNIIDSVLSAGKIVRPVLGLTYIDLSQVDGLISWGDKGAYVAGVLKASPAFGLIKEGDVIKKVNDEELSVFN